MWPKNKTFLVNLVIKYLYFVLKKKQTVSRFTQTQHTHSGLTIYGNLHSALVTVIYLFLMVN